MRSLWMGGAVRRTSVVQTLVLRALSNQVLLEQEKSFGSIFKPLLCKSRKKVLGAFSGKKVLGACRSSLFVPHKLDPNQTKLSEFRLSRILRRI